MRCNVAAIAFAFFAVITMAFSCVSVGFASASSYTATTQSTNNTISATDYFTAGLYTYNQSVTEDDVILDFNNSNFTPIAVSPFNLGELAYKNDNGNYIVTNGAANCTIDKLFLAINTSNHTLHDSYSVSYTVSGLEEAGFTGNATISWGGNNPDLEPNKAYRLYLNLRNIYYSGDEIPSLTLNITITVTDHNSASYYSPNNGVTFRLSTTVDDFKEDLDESNTDLSDSGMEFYPDQGSGSDPPGVYIQNEGSNNHSIAGSDTGNSEISVAVSIPSGLYVCIYVTIEGAFTIFTDKSEVKIAVKKINSTTGATITDYSNLTLKDSSWTGSDIKKYVYLNNNSKLTSGNSKPSNTNNYFHCDPGQEISISFIGEQNTSWLGATMTVTAKLVQK